MAIETKPYKTDELAKLLYERATRPTSFASFIEMRGVRLTRRQRLRNWWRTHVAWRFARRNPAEEGW